MEVYDVMSCVVLDVSHSHKEWMVLWRHPSPSPPLPWETAEVHDRINIEMFFFSYQFCLKCAALANVRMFVYHDYSVQTIAISEKKTLWYTVVFFVTEHLWTLSPCLLQCEIFFFCMVPRHLSHLSSDMLRHSYQHLVTATWKASYKLRQFKKSQ